MLTFMLDTNICIEVIRGSSRELGGRFNGEAERICFSSVTLGELCFGAENSARRDANLLSVEHIASRLDCLAFDAAAARHYGMIRADLRRRGVTIGLSDLLIAAHARSSGLTVVTNNRREFDRVPGLAVEDWLAEARQG